MPRRPRRMQLGSRFHVTARGAAQAAIYLAADDCVTFLRLLRSVVDRWHWDLDALCLMGNHYHLVLRTSGPRLSAGMHRLNGVYAQAFNDKYGRSGHLFGDRFASRPIETEEHLYAACRYVL